LALPVNFDEFDNDSITYRTPGKVKMAPRTSKKSQADLMAVVKAAGWKEDQKTAGDKHIRWWHPSKPETY
jgi:hypothetical protein